MIINVYSLWMDILNILEEMSYFKVLQNRFDGSMDFYRNLSEYEHGFGNLSGEHMLGEKGLFILMLTRGKFYFLKYQQRPRYQDR
jgi:hypothetical protein